MKQSWKLDLVLVKTKSNATNKATDKGGNKSRTSKREGPTNPTETGATLEKKKRGTSPKRPVAASLESPICQTQPSHQSMSPQQTWQTYPILKKGVKAFLL